MENVQFALLHGDLQINMGSILENVVAQELKAHGFQLNYYDGKKTGEIDFVLQNGMQVDLLEVKSGKDFQAAFSPGPDAPGRGAGGSARQRCCARATWPWRTACAICPGI